MYYEYWGLNSSPFDNVPDPKMFFSMHRSVADAVSELLFAIQEGDECLAVVVGEVGLGKTMTLRAILDRLDPRKYRIAFITNPDVTFNQLLRDVIGQLKGEPCEIKKKDELLELFNRLLFETIDSGSKVLIFIDEGNAFKTANLQSLRLLTNMQEDTRNLFTIILAGQPKLAKMLEDPRQANLFQRIGVYCRLEKMESPDVVRFYIEHRLERAGTTRKIFSDEAVERIHEFSDGVPRLVNKMCKLCLKAGQTNGLQSIDGEIASAIADRFQKTFGPSKKIKDKAAKEKRAEEKAEAKLRKEKPRVTRPREEMMAEAPGPAAPVQEDQSQEVLETEPALDAATEEVVAPQEVADEVQGEEQVLAGVTEEVIEKAKQLDKYERLRFAGQIAARQIKMHPEMVKKAQDPVARWKDLRQEIMQQFK